MQCLLVFLLIYISFATCGSLQCTWSKGSGYKLVPYATHNLPISYSHGVPTEESCKELCLQQTSFLCAAYNYYTGSGSQCELLAESDLTATKQNYRDYGWSYAIRPECAGLWMPWTAVTDVSITTSSADTIVVESVGELRTCMSYCMQTTFPSSHNKDCRSILTAATGYSCDLVNMRSDDTGANVAGTPGVVLFNRPVWYLDHSTGSIVEAVEGSGVSSNYSLVLLDTYGYRIPVDGHLVAWQYHIGTANNSCFSFASIWREISREYSRIAETELTPENPERGGVRFQYVQDSTVVVQENDFLGFYVDSNQGCGGNIISVSDGGNKYVRSYGGKYETPHPTNLSPQGGDVRYPYLQVALKAYIAEFIKLEDAVTTHNSSLSQGQIKLTWKEPTEQNNQYQPGTGYIKVECSTDPYFSTIVDCLPNVVAIENMEIVLEQLDITQPHYARLYVVRNYNGEELEQRRSSNDFYQVNNGQPFCAERDQREINDVTLTEEGQITPHQPITLLIASEAASNDRCIDKVTLSYYGTSKTFNNDQSEWRIQVDQGVKTMINIRYTLVDGYNISVWNGQYTTEQAPQPPQLLPVAARGTTSVELSWLPPVSSNYQITSYQVSCHTLNHTYNQVATESAPSWNTFNATTHSFIISPLYPQVRYACAVRTNIVNGYSDLTGYETFWTKPAALELNFSGERPKVFNDRVDIALPEILTQSLTGYESMQLAVEVFSTRHERDLTSKYIGSSERYYITARIPILDIPKVFTIGDNETYGGYVNVPLAVGDYAFHIGFKAQTEEIVDFTAIPDSQVEIKTTTDLQTEPKDSTESTETTEARQATESTGKTVQSTKGTSTSGGLVWGLVAGLVIVTILSVCIIAGLIIYFKRKANQGPGDERNQQTENIHIRNLEESSDYTALTQAADNHIYEKPEATTSAATSLLHHNQPDVQGNQDGAQCSGTIYETVH